MQTASLNILRENVVRGFNSLGRGGCPTTPEEFLEILEGPELEERKEFFKDCLITRRTVKDFFADADEQKLAEYHYFLQDLGF